MQAVSSPTYATPAASVIEGSPSLRSRVSWGAVFAGAIVALTIGLMLSSLGAGVAAYLVNTTAQKTPSASSFGLGAGLWLLFSHLFALAVGGYTASRLSGTTDDTDSTLHGIAVWAVAFLTSAVLLGNVLAGIASTASTGAASVIGGLAQGTGSIAAAAGQQAADRTSTNTLQAAAQSLVDRAQNALGGGDPATMTPDQRKAEIATTVGRGVKDGKLSDQDRTRLSALVAAEYNISQQDAQQRVQQAEQQTQQMMQQAEQKARETADAAAKTTAKLSFAAFLTMLLSLGAAILGSRNGTRDILRSTATGIRA